MADRRSWLTLDTFGKLIGGLVAISTVGVVLVGYMAFAYYAPDIEVAANAVGLIDMDTLVERYEPGPVPEIVLETAGAYNRARVRDLNTGNNVPLHALSTVALCVAISHPRISAIFPDTDCTSEDPRIGRNRYFERLLLCRNEEALHPGDRYCDFTDEDDEFSDAETDLLEDDGDFSDLEGIRRSAEVRTALEHLTASEYRRAKVIVTNEGNGMAERVVISPSDGYVPATESTLDPFNLAPTGSWTLVDLGEELNERSEQQRRRNDQDLPVVRSFVTEVGVVDGTFGITRPGDPAGGSFLDFRASWEASSRFADHTPLTLLLVLLVGLFMAFVAFDLITYVHRD